MNAILILFLLVVIAVAIYLAAVYFNPDYLIRNSTKINTGTGGQKTIDVASIENPGSTRYYYEGWFYIIGNQQVVNENILFNRGTEFVVSLQGSTLKLYVNGGKVNNDNGTYDPSGNNPLITVPNFPFQKWAQLVINVDGMTVDLYIDGQFVQNKMNSTTIGSTAETNINYGNKYTIGNVARFKRPASSINPQGVWRSYMLGSGQNQSLTDYHVNAVVTKNQRQTINQRLF